MKDYVEYVIENKTSNSVVKSVNKKKNLINKIHSKLGVRLSKSLSIKELENILNQ